MNTTDITSRLREWHNEYATMVSDHTPVSDGFLQFVARRMADSGMVADDPDVITVLLSGVPRRVRITGTHGPRLAYELADGSRGMGIVDKRNIAQSDRGKLTAILERLLADGKVREG